MIIGTVCRFSMNSPFNLCVFNSNLEETEHFAILNLEETEHFDNINLEERDLL